MFDFLRNIGDEISHPERNLFYIGLAVVLGILVRYVLYFSFWVIRKKTGSFLVTRLMQRLRGSFLLLLPAFFILFFMPLLKADPGVLVFIQRGVQIIFIIAFTWVMIALAYVFEDVLFAKLNINKPDNYRERRLRTQVQFIRRLLISIFIILSVAVIFTRFEGMRRLGTTMLASAGIIGIIFGIAAQRSIANFLAGLQIAFTQPIRIDDVVIVEGEWGRIEEITLTYVVVRIWDMRKMILPITYFVEKPFQNWTRRTSELLGSAFIYTDYSVPFEEIRKELYKIASDSPLWNGEVCELAATDLTETTVELRALISARNSEDTFNLRCLIREKLVEFLRAKYPESLPRFRAEMHPLRT